MEKLMKCVKSVVLAVSVGGVIILSGCGSSGGAEATADAVVTSAIARGADSEQMLAMFKKQPEFKATVECFIRSLNDQGWTGSDHGDFMDATNDTGDFAKIDNNQYSEAEALEKFGPIAVASSTCM